MPLSPHFDQVFDRYLSYLNNDPFHPLPSIPIFPKEGTTSFTSKALVERNFLSDLDEVVIYRNVGNVGCVHGALFCQELGVDVGDSVFLIEEYVGNNRCLILSKTPKIPDRIDELTEAWDKPSLR